MNFKAYIQSAE